MNPIEISTKHTSEDKSEAAVDLYRHPLGVGTNLIALGKARNRGN